MSYSISKTNYIINAVSYGNNRTQRTSIDFGTYEPSTESTGTEPSFPTRVLEGPQVTFGDTTATSGSDRAPPLPETNILQSATIEQFGETAITGGARITPLSEINVLQPTGIPRAESPVSDADSILDVLNYIRTSAVRRRTNEASNNASTALGRNRN